MIPTTFRTGGVPESLVPFGSASEYLARSDELGPHRVVGGGSNLLVADDGPSGTVAVIASESDGVVDLDGSRARLDAGGNWHATTLRLGAEGLGGVESLVGIPGTVGGAVVQNIGAYGQEICEVVERVEVVSTASGVTCWFSAQECRFGYRDSVFKSTERGRHVVTAVELRLRPGELHVPAYSELAGELERRCGQADRAGGYRLDEVHESVLALRSNKNMVWQADDPRTWGAGSFFVNPTIGAGALGEITSRLGATPPSWELTAGRHKISAGWLVERAGFERGHRWATVGLTEGHALGLVNITGRASSADVLEAANEIASAVTRMCGLRLLAEPILFGFDAGIELAFDAHIEP